MGKVPKFLLSQDLGLGIHGNVVAVLNWAESAEGYFKNEVFPAFFFPS